MRHFLDAEAAPGGPDFLAGGGQMGALMRSLDWVATPVGPPETWPQALKTTVRLVLTSQHPMFIWWGEALTCFYNDAYSALIGPDRHPSALGRPGREVWAEIWDVIGPQIEFVMAGRGATWHERQLIPITRGEAREDVWWTYGYSPIDDQGSATSVGGVLVICRDVTAEVRAEQAHAEEVDRLRKLFEQAPTFMAILRGPQHTIELANPNYMRLVGYREVLGKTVAEALPDAIEQGYLDLLDAVYRSKKAFTAWGAKYAVQVTPGGPVNERFVDFVYQPITDAKGEVTGIFVEGVDVTDRASAITALCESEARLRELNADLERQVLERSHVRGRTWQLSPDLLGVLNADGYFESANPAWRAVLGWSEAEISQTSLFRFIHPDDLDRTYAGFEDLKRGNPVLRFENRYRRKDGEYRWLSWVAVPEGDKFYCSARDITAEKHQAAELAARTVERDRVWRNSRDLLVIVGADGIFRAINPAWTAILGHDPTKVVGRSFLDFVWPDDADLTQGGLDTAASKNDLTNFENRYRHQDGTPRWISWHTSVEGDVVYAYGRDITAEKEQARALRQAEEQLRQAQKMEAVGQLTGGIAHDFNNLLTGISGALELLQRRVEEGRTADLYRYVGIAAAAAKRAAALTQRLLAFARRQPLDPRPVNANRLVASMEELLRRTLGPAIELEMVLAGGLWSALCDPNQLESAILNLAINARDAMPEGGRLTVETANAHLDEAYARAEGGEVRPGQYVTVSVTDTGAGMPPEVVARVFEPFFTTKPTGEGTGLGLSMLYGFVKQSGGHVRAYSELGRGTTMRLYLPRHRSGKEESTAPPVPAKPGAASGTVLLVEDEAAIRAMAAEMLAELGCRVLEAADGPAGLRILEGGARIDLLVTDVGLPGGLNGRQLADAARERRPALPVLFITGYAHNAAVGNGAALDPGMEMMTKPFALDALATKIRGMIERGPGGWSERTRSGRYRRA